MASHMALSNVWMIRKPVSVEEDATNQNKFVIVCDFYNIGVGTKTNSYAYKEYIIIFVNSFLH